jgi:hypothetical protein
MSAPAGRCDVGELVDGVVGDGEAGEHHSARLPSKRDHVAGAKEYRYTENATTSSSTSANAITTPRRTKRLKALGFSAIQHCSTG